MDRSSPCLTFPDRSWSFWSFLIVLIVPDRFWSFLTPTIRFLIDPNRSWPISNFKNAYFEAWIVPHRAWRFLAVAGRTWSFLTLPDCSWSFLAVPDRSYCSWLFLIVPDCSWSFLIVPDTNDQVSDRYWPMIDPDGLKRSKKGSFELPYRGVITFEHLGQMLHIKTQFFAPIEFFYLKFILN